MTVTPRACREYEHVPAAVVPSFVRLFEKLLTGAGNVQMKKIREGRLRTRYQSDNLYTARATLRNRLVFSLDGGELVIHGFRDRGDKQTYRGER